MDMEYMIKAKKFRANMNTSGNEMSSIMDMSAKTVITLMHKHKMYMTYKMDNAFATGAKHPLGGKFYKASGSKTILGYSCEHWIYEGKTGKTDMWLTTGLGVFLGLSGGKTDASGADDWVKAVKAKGLFPLEMDSTGKDNKTMSIVATKVEPKSLSDSLFEVPAGYKKMNMPDFGNMGGGTGKKPTKEDIMKMMEQFKK